MDTENKLRGETPKDIKEKVFQLCKDYIGGEWANVDADQLIIRRISGGMTNQLYYCSLPNDVDVDIAKRPKEVAIRLYNKKHFNESEGNERIPDLVINLLTSKYNLGPKIYGIFEGGEILEYIQCRQFWAADQINISYIQKLAQKLAHFHALKVPLEKEPKWFDTFLHDHYSKACRLFNIKEMAKEINAETLYSTDVGAEIEWLLSCVRESNSAVVFSHNDFRPPNILVHEDNDKNQITLCDFDYSAYYYRGFDFSTYFSQYGKQSYKSDFGGSFPDDEPIELFVNFYREESAKIHDKQFLEKPENSVRHLINEAKIFRLCDIMFVVIMVLAMEDIPLGQTKAHLLGYANKQLEIYNKWKSMLISEEIIPLKFRKYHNNNLH